MKELTYYLKSIILVLILVALLFSSTLNALVSYPVTNLQREEDKIKYDDISENKLNKGKFILKLKENLSESERNNFIAKNKLEKGKMISRFKFTTKDLHEISAWQYIEKIEEDSTVEAQALKVNDPLANEQWYFEAINQNVQIDDKKSADPQIVAVIDSGICFDHPDLQNRIVEGWNFVDNNSNTSDSLGHGCAVSGIIAANTNNNIGIAGGSLKAKIMPLKVVSSNGTASYSDLINAIDYAVDKKVSVINISLGGFFPSEILHDSIVKASKLGIKIVSSAGNTSSDEILYPARFEEVISVGSVENDYSTSTFSSTSKKIDVWAYGSDILSTSLDGGYQRLTGTSIAAGIASAFIVEGGEFIPGNIINFTRKDLKPIYKNVLVNITEPISKLELNIPEGLPVEGFENLTSSSFFIDWQKVIKVAAGENVVVSVWNRKNPQEIRSVYKTILIQDKCTDHKEKEGCIVNFPHKEGQNSGFGKYFVRGNRLIRVLYTFKDFVGYRLYKKIVNTITVDNQKLFQKDELSLIESKVDLDKILPQATNLCGGFQDSANPYNNPYDCCANGGNCVWYAAYKRPDLKGVITKWPEGLFTQAVQAGFPVSNQPSKGALIVWQTHVAYVESFTASSVTWSEQNCYGTPYNASVTRNSYSPSYSAGNFLGYIHTKSGDCNGANQKKSNWNVNGPLSCNPTGTFTISPESRLDSQGGTISIIMR